MLTVVSDIAQLMCRVVAAYMAAGLVGWLGDTESLCMCFVAQSRPWMLIRRGRSIQWLRKRLQTLSYVKDKVELIKAFPTSQRRRDNLRH